MKTNTATIAMIVAMVAMIGMTGFATAGSTMDYTVDFDGIGDGSVTIGTLTPIGTDMQQVNWNNCEAFGTQAGHYGNNGWMTIDRNTRIDTARANDTGTMDHGPVFGSILTLSELNTDGGNWTAGKVATSMILNDSYHRDM